MSRETLKVGLAALSAMLVLTEPAFAVTTGASLPWEGPIGTLRDSLTGPVAGIIALIAIAIAGGMLVFGGELADFGRRVCYIVMVLGLLVAAAAFLTAFYPAAAVISAAPPASLPSELLAAFAGSLLALLAWARRRRAVAPVDVEAVPA